jgi:hypothetical protein
MTCPLSEEKRRFQVFDEAAVGRHTIRSSVVTSAKDAAQVNLHALSASPLRLHTFTGVDVPPSDPRAHLQRKRVIDLTGALLPASMGGVVKPKAYKRRSGMGSVKQNEVCLSV